VDATVRSGPSPASPRRPWMATAIWGWRLEIFLTVSSLLVLTIAARIDSDGPFLIVVLVLLALRLRPDIRQQLLHYMRTNRDHRRLSAALWHCVIVGRNGSIPKIVRSANLPVGRRYLLHLPIGLHAALIEKSSLELAAALSAREVRIKASPVNASYVELAVIRSNAFPKMLTSPLLQQAGSSLWEPLFIGVGQDGLDVSIGLPEHNLLIGGEPGSGKSVALSTIVAAAALDPSVRLTLLDGKEVELIAWSDVADEFVGASQEAAVAVLEDLRDVMNDRYALLAHHRRRKMTADDLEGLRVLVIDELAFYLRGGQKVFRDQFGELLRDLVSRGRAAGIIVVATTQKPSHEIVPTWIRDLFSYRLAMRCTSSDSSDTILGQGWASQGFSAATIDPSMRGVGFLLAEGGVPTLVMTPHLSDDEVEFIATRAYELRYGK
jgi:DNA segregation ATPase FtsK/SpoIIIE-like protein